MYLHTTSIREKFKGDGRNAVSKKNYTRLIWTQHFSLAGNCS